MKSTPYDYPAATKLENYVRKRYWNQLSPGELSFYCNAFPHLERSGLGLCAPITASYKDMAKAGFRDPSRIREVLAALEGVLCEVLIGSPIKNGKCATQIRRYSLQELMRGEPKSKLVDYAPPDSRMLADLLASRSFTYGDNIACLPFWNVLKTGRIQSSKPNIQGDPEPTRVTNLSAGLRPGEVLFNLDYKSAEPTLIQHACSYKFDSDPYMIAASLFSITRDEAKRKVNKIAYFPDSVKAVSFWQCPPAVEAFMPYATAIEERKQVLWDVGAPRNKKRRFVHTLTGSKIESDRADSPHRGRILSWQIQGTVADLLNAATLQAIELEAVHGWRVLVPLHDALYVAGRPEHVEVLRNIMQADSNKLGLPLTVRIHAYEKGGVVCKCI